MKEEYLFGKFVDLLAAASQVCKVKSVHFYENGLMSIDGRLENGMKMCIYTVKEDKQDG